MAGFEATSLRFGETGIAAFFKKLLLFAVDMAVFIPFFVMYYFLRGLPVERVELSTENALRIIRFEQALGIFHEATWQQAILDNSTLVSIANFTYQWLHMPLLVGLGFLFFLTSARKHRVVRNAILLSAFMAVPVYLAFPVTPPRLLADAGHAIYGFVDTIPEEGRTKPGGMANWYAAVPSYHFGWIFVGIIGVFWCWKNALVRGVAIAFGGLMWWAIVVTGNHYFVDMVIGAVFVTACFLIALHWERWTERNPEKAGKFTFRVGSVRLPF